MSLKFSRYSYALMMVALIDAALLWWGLQLLFIPPIFKLARMHSPFLYYEGHILVILSVILAWFRQWIALKLIWLCEEVHRLVSALMMASVIGIEAFLHLLSIPHVEGWWLSMLGGSVFFGATAGWIQKWRKTS